MDPSKKSFRSVVHTYDRMVRDLRAHLLSDITTLPDNSRIQRLGGSGNCFTIQFSRLEHNWSPFYHDFKAQYRFLVSVLDEKELPVIRRTLIQVIRTGKYVLRCSGYGCDTTLYFHPDVRKHLRALYCTKYMGGA